MYAIRSYYVRALGPRFRAALAVTVVLEDGVLREDLVLLLVEARRLLAGVHERQRGDRQPGAGKTRPA